MAPANMWIANKTEVWPLKQKLISNRIEVLSQSQIFSELETQATVTSCFKYFLPFTQVITFSGLLAL